MSLDTWNSGPPTAAETVDTDAWLWRVMQSAKNKAMIASLEDSLHLFLLDPSQTQLPFPPRSPFHRKVCYLVARRYGLAHRLEPFPGGASPALEDPHPPVRLVLLKTPHSALPAVRLALLADGPMPDADRVSKLADVDTAAEKVVVSSTKFLRRPRNVDGSAAPLSRPLSASSASAAAGATLRSYSEEDYRKARARIFKCAERDNDARDSSQATQPADEDLVVGKLVTKPGHIAKGPIEGSPGFERRRNRRNTTVPSNHPASVDKQYPTKSAQRSSHPCVRNMQDLPPTHSDGSRMSAAVNASAAGSSGNTGDISACISTGADADIGSGGGDDGGNTGGDGNGSTTGNGVPNIQVYNLNGPRRQSSHAAQAQNRSDRQDPDFDRRYDKWAVRTAPPPPPHAQQQVSLPIFGQLLYPYNVQAGAQHLHPSALHLRSVNAPVGQVQQANIGQYQSIQLQHAPTGAMMFQHLGQSIGGLAEYAGRSLNLTDRTSPYDASTVEQLGISHSREMSSLQHQTLPSQVTRTPSPAYGLDSTVDFPPLQ